MGTVTIGCKLPNGLHLTVYNMVDGQEPIMGGGWRTVKKAEYAGRVTVKGVGRRVDDPRVAFGAALTHGVDADHWARWLEANKDSDVVKNGLIFAAVKQDDVKSEARLNEATKTGMEPIAPASLPKEFMGKIETAKAT